MFVHSCIKMLKQIVVKVNFLNQAESFMSESYISQLHGNADEDTLFKEWWKENSWKDLNKIEDSFAEGT